MTTLSVESPTAQSHSTTALVDRPAWMRLRDAAAELATLQAADGSVTDTTAGAALVEQVADAVGELAPHLPHDADYLAAVQTDLRRWVDEGLGVPDFLDALAAFRPELDRVDGREHLVVFPMYTQNGSTERKLEAVLLQVFWPDWLAEIEDGRTGPGYGNPKFVPITFTAFTPGYDTNSAVLFPESVAVRETPVFTWGGIFCDRESARFRLISRAVCDTTHLQLPEHAAELLVDQQTAQETFVLWDLIHDRSHSHGDLPFDPFMIKQRMPFFLYSLEELRCDLTAFRACLELAEVGVAQAALVPVALLLDRGIRFPLTGTRVRNYDSVAGQLLFAHLHQSRVLHWTDNALSVDWEGLPAAVLALLERIEDLYWRSIDRPKVAHWLAAHELVSSILTPHPASTWAHGELPLDGPPKGLVDLVHPDEFPLSMFFEALAKKLRDVVASTAGITAADPRLA
ncbi:MAG: DUF6421 family protein [Mycobacteriaceae bacterium]